MIKFHKQLWKLTIFVLLGLSLSENIWALGLDSRLDRRLGQINIGEDYYIDQAHALNRPRSDYEPYARQMAKNYNIPEDIFINLITVESNWHDGAHSYVGAIGLTQLMPDTARYLGVKDPWDPYQNLEGGARYLAEQYREFGDWRLALAAYNAGPNAVRKYNGIPPYAETEAYVKKIMGA